MKCRVATSKLIKTGNWSIFFCLGRSMKAIERVDSGKFDDRADAPTAK